MGEFEATKAVQRARLLEVADARESVSRQRTAHRELQSTSAAGVLEIYYTATGRRRPDDVLGWKDGFNEGVVDRIREVEERLRRVNGFQRAMTHGDSVVDCIMGLPSGTGTAAAYGGATSSIERCARRAVEGGEACKSPNSQLTM